MVIDAREHDFKKLNELIRNAGENCTVENCLGQRFIGSGLDKITVSINGIPGNALGAYLNGGEIFVHGNAQDAVGDTMNAGKIVIYGNAGDAVGYAMRGGEIYISGNAGYRAGIHMKAYRDKLPVMVIGQSCGSFLGEYQAGGIIIVLGLGCEGRAAGFFPGTGMHGGKIYLRGNYKDLKVPSQVNLTKATPEDLQKIQNYVDEFCRLFGKNSAQIMSEEFYILSPNTKNPYHQMYVFN
jgi:glutamate synthase domain-containing protein 3